MPVFQLNKNFMRKIPPGSEVVNLLVGEMAELDKIIAVFVRLKVRTGDNRTVPKYTLTHSHPTLSHTTTNQANNQEKEIALRVHRQ